MSDLAKSSREGWPIQAFQLPANAATTTLTAATSAPLHGGMYRIVATGPVTIALGLTATTGLPLSSSQPEYFEVPHLATVTVAGAGSVSLTLMPSKLR